MLPDASWVKIPVAATWPTAGMPLRKLQRMASLNHKFFKDLTKQQQEKILDTPIRSIVIDAGANAELRYEVFERLNRGSMTSTSRNFETVFTGGRSTISSRNSKRIPTGG